MLRTFAIVKIPPGATFSYDGSDADIRLRRDLDHLNFSEFESGTSFRCLGGRRTRRLEVVAGGDFGVAGRYFDYAGHEIRLSQRAILAMLTVDAQAVRWQRDLFRASREQFARSSHNSALTNVPTISVMQAMLQYDRNPL
jgi:hypothetical protein